MRTARVLALSATLSALPLSAFAAEHGVDPATLSGATTPAQHQALAERFRGYAEEARRDADAYLAMSKAYAATSAASRMQLAGHCQQIATEYQELSLEYDGLAKAEEAAAHEK